MFNSVNASLPKSCLFPPQNFFTQRTPPVPIPEPSIEAAMEEVLQKEMARELCRTPGDVWPFSFKHGNVVRFALIVCTLESGSLKYRFIHFSNEEELQNALLPGNFFSRTNFFTNVKEKNQVERLRDRLKIDYVLIQRGDFWSVALSDKQVCIFCHDGLTIKWHILKPAETARFCTQLGRDMGKAIRDDLELPQSLCNYLLVNARTGFINPPMLAATWLPHLYRGEYRHFCDVQTQCEGYPAIYPVLEKNGLGEAVFHYFLTQEKLNRFLQNTQLVEGATRAELEKIFFMECVKHIGLIAQPKPCYALFYNEDKSYFHFITFCEKMDSYYCTASEVEFTNAQLQKTHYPIPIEQFAHLPLTSFETRIVQDAFEKRLKQFMMRHILRFKQFTLFSLFHGKYTAFVSLDKDPWETTTVTIHFYRKHSPLLQEKIKECQTLRLTANVLLI